MKLVIDVRIHIQLLLQETSTFVGFRVSCRTSMEKTIITKTERHANDERIGKMSVFLLFSNRSLQAFSTWDSIALSLGCRRETYLFSCVTNKDLIISHLTNASSSSCLDDVCFLPFLNFSRTRDLYDLLGGDICSSAFQLRSR
jgi:hypothetical protein